MLFESAQAVLGALAGQEAASAFVGSMSSIASNATTNATTSATPTANPMPSDLGSLITFVLSLGALRDWMKIFIIGGLVESARRFVTYLYYALLESFLLTVEIDGDDQAYSWMLLWLSKHERWTKARTLELTSRRYSGRGNNDDEFARGKEINMAPTMGEAHFILFSITWIIN